MEIFTKKGSGSLGFHGDGDTQGSVDELVDRHLQRVGAELVATLHVDRFKQV